MNCRWLGMMAALALGLATERAIATDLPVIADKVALAPWQEVVGGWRGVGQVRRGSNQGAWTEEADWAWNFAEGRAALVFTAPQNKYYRSGRLTPGAKLGEVELALVHVEGDATDRFLGAQAEGVWTFTRTDAPADAPARVTMKLLAEGARLTLLLERRSGDTYNRIAEVGYTRMGSNFGSGSSRPECVVTGGAGTIAVQHEGKTYYVCCTGCRDLFNDDPAKILAEYRERLAVRK